MTQMPELIPSDHPFLAGGGEMGKLIRSVNWAKTPIGDPDRWPEPLRLAVSIMLSTPFPMYIAWGKEYIQLYNDGYRPILGSSKHPQAMGISTQETFVEIWETIGPMFDDVMKGEAVGFPDFMLPLDRNGFVEECFFDFSYSPIRFADRSVGGVLVTVIETTENKKNLALLRKSEQHLTNIIHHAPVAIANLAGKELVIDSANDKMLGLWGKTSSIIGKPLAVALPELNGQPFLDILAHTFESGEVYVGNEAKSTMEHAGELREGYFNFIYQPIKNDVGITESITVVASEVTELIRTRKELEAAYEQSRLSKQAAMLGTFDLDLVNGTMEWDERCRTLFGISHQQQVNYEHDFVKGLHPEDRDRVINLIADVMNKSKSNGDYDVEYRTVGVEDAAIRWVRAKGKAYFDQQDQPVRFIGSVLEMTDQKQAEELMKESVERQARLASIVDTSDDTILSKTLQGIITSWNKAAERMFGYSEGEAVGRHISLIIPADRLNEEEYIISQISQGNKVDHFETKRITKDGRMIPISLSISPIKDGNGNIIGASKIARDISQQQAEKEERLRLYEQVKALNEKKDEFIGLASHELKTPLTSINGYLQILSRIEVEGQGKLFIQKTLQQVNRLTGLVNDLLDVSKIEAGKLQLNIQPTDIRNLVDDAIELLRHFNTKYEIYVSTEVTQLKINIDSQRVEQVLINLLSNAIKYSPENYRIDVILIQEGEQVRIGVKDYGIGIPQHKINEIFSRFYRVEEVNPNISGLGIGLYISQEIVTRHGGVIQVESELGKGSTFWVTLPMNN